MNKDKYDLSLKFEKTCQANKEVKYSTPCKQFQFQLCLINSHFLITKCQILYVLYKEKLAVDNWLYLDSQVFVAPAVYYIEPTDALPIPITSQPVPYWIIAAVLGPVVFLIILLLICLMCWRWKKGAPQTKIEPETMQMMKRDRGKMVIKFVSLLVFPDWRK